MNSTSLSAPTLQLLQQTLGAVIRGKPECIDLLITALLSGGSVLLEDVPGVGKTTLAKAVAAALSLSFSRVQFTPDLLPADILGSSVYNPVTGDFAFRQGPIFNNLLLADEINRASPRTQSALLEAMGEGQATVDGQRRPLPEPFFVLATQNPIEFHGTYPLPEAQLDRFLIQVNLGYPDVETELEILYQHQHANPLASVHAVMTRDELLQLQHRTQTITVDPGVGQYIVELTHRSRRDPRLRLGVSPRGALMLFRASQAAALLRGRDYVLPDDVQWLCGPVLAHRIVLASQSRNAGNQRLEIIRELVADCPAPA
jgi:MoxR-like ATPase